MGIRRKKQVRERLPDLLFFYPASEGAGGVALTPASPSCRRQKGSPIEKPTHTFPSEGR